MVNPLHLWFKFDEKIENIHIKTFIYDRVYLQGIRPQQLSHPKYRWSFTCFQTSLNKCLVVAALLFYTRLYATMFFSVITYITRICFVLHQKRRKHEWSIVNLLLGNGKNAFSKCSYLLVICLILSKVSFNEIKKPRGNNKGRYKNCHPVVEFSNIFSLPLLHFTQRLRHKRLN